MFCNICLFRPLGFGEGEVRAEEDACEDQDATQAQVFAGGERVRADLGEIGIPRKRLCAAEKVDQHLVIPNSVKEVAQHVYLYAVGENCGLCGFSSSQKRGQKRGLRNHVEKHLAFYYPCVFCKYEPEPDLRWCSITTKATSCSKGKCDLIRLFGEGGRTLRLFFLKGLMPGRSTMLATM